MQDGEGERFKWLRRLRKGGGIYERREDVPFSEFGVGNWYELVELLGSVIGLFRDSDAITAARYALAAGGALGETNLSTRRAKAAEELGVSERTVMRLEEEGFKILDRTIADVNRPEYAANLIGECLLRVTLARRTAHLHRFMNEEYLGVAMDALYLSVQPRPGGATEGDPPAKDVNGWIRF